MKRLSIVAVGVIAAVVGTAVLWTNQADRSAEPVPTAATLQTAVFRVDQMTCATCPITVKAAMSAVTEVASVEVDVDAKTATVRFDPAIAAPPQIAEASTNAGYPAAPVS
jgi:mercuric ion binding protein